MDISTNTPFDARYTRIGYDTTAWDLLTSSGIYEQLIRLARYT
jgi:hypothetical protein